MTGPERPGQRRQQLAGLSYPDAPRTAARPGQAQSSCGRARAAPGAAEPLTGQPAQAPLLRPPSSGPRGPCQPRPLNGQPPLHVRRPAPAIGPDARQESPQSPPPTSRRAGAEPNTRLRAGSGRMSPPPPHSPPAAQPRPALPPSLWSSTPAGLTFFTSKRFLPAPLLVPLGVSTSIAAAILDARITRAPPCACATERDAGEVSGRGGRGFL